MKLTEQQKKRIKDDLAAYTNEYCGKSREERKSKGQFFTPASMVIQMLEMFDCEEPGDQTILDPTAGNGNLLVGALIAGFKPENVYGNELDTDIYELLVERLSKYGVPKENLVNMDCLSDEFKRWCEKVDLSKYSKKREGPTADIKFNFGTDYLDYVTRLKDVSWPRLINMGTEEKKENFKKWYYETTDKLVNKLRQIISDCEGITPLPKYYIDYFPQVDWSHPWTDKEILKEIGLPGDFLDS